MFDSLISLLNALLLPLGGLGFAVGCTLYMLAAVDSFMQEVGTRILQASGGGLLVGLLANAIAALYTNATGI